MHLVVQTNSFHDNLFPQAPSTSQLDLDMIAFPKTMMWLTGVKTFLFQHLVPYNTQPHYTYLSMCSGIEIYLFTMVDRRNVHMPTNWEKAYLRMDILDLVFVFRVWLNNAGTICTPVHTSILSSSKFLSIGSKSDLTRTSRTLSGGNILEQVDRTRRNETISLNLRYDYSLKQSVVVVKVKTRWKRCVWIWHYKRSSQQQCQLSFFMTGFRNNTVLKLDHANGEIAVIGQIHPQRTTTVIKVRRWPEMLIFKQLRKN